MRVFTGFFALFQLLEEKADLTKRRFALEKLIDNRIPRCYLATEPVNALTESSYRPANLADVFPPRENLSTVIIAITISGNSRPPSGCIEILP